MRVLRANSRLGTAIGAAGAEFVEFAAGAIQRVLPHVATSPWAEDDWDRPGAFWVDNRRRELRVTISFGDKDASGRKSVSSYITRRKIPVATVGLSTLDTREHDICKRIALRISEIVKLGADSNDARSLQAIRSSFDEEVIAEHIKHHHDLRMPIIPLLSALHTLSQQTYENKALVFGCILDAKNKSASEVQFPAGYLGTKKYKALSDGFRTAYRVSCHGKLVDLASIEVLRKSKGKQFYPDWAASMARTSRGKRCGIALTRQGDILVFDTGALRFSYRYGRWQYWNHSHVTRLLRDRARAQRVPPEILGNVVGSIYRSALDVSFRRSGALFVILHNRNSLHSIVRKGDAIQDDRSAQESEFDQIVQRHKVVACKISIGGLSLP